MKTLLALILAATISTGAVAYPDCDSYLRQANMYMAANSIDMWKLYMERYQECARDGDSN
jgi:hypothetical protein